MKSLVLFHSILGLRPVEHELARIFAGIGYQVTVPDLFGAKTATSYEDGFSLRDQIGDEVIQARAAAALDEASPDAVLAGVSFGAFLIGQFWQSRPQMPGALLLSGVAPWQPTLRTGLPLSVHIARPDPFDDEQFFQDWEKEAASADLDIHRYDHAGHYFLDNSLADYDTDAAALCIGRCLAFLQSLP